jgi:alpha-galactosidase
MEGHTGEVVASRVSRDFLVNASNPAREWESANATRFSQDWRGEDPDPGRETTVRILWTGQNLYVRFECLYREIFVFADSDPNGRRDHLWERDVAEAFLQPEPTKERHYKEFEVAPNGMWLDLDISPGGRADLKSGLQRSVSLDEKRLTWSAELAIPIKSVTPDFDPKAIWRTNFYRVEGPAEPRSYLAWQPTKTPQPNFHVPGAFGRLRFAD